MTTFDEADCLKTNPFEGDFGSPGDKVLKDKICTARKGGTCGEYLRKGSLVYIEGKITTRKWQDKDGQDRHTTEIQVYEMKMLGGRPERSESSDDYAPAHEKKPAVKSDAFDDLSSDIPF